MRHRCSGFAIHACMQSSLPSDSTAYDHKWATPYLREIVIIPPGSYSGSREIHQFQSVVATERELVKRFLNNLLNHLNWSITELDQTLTVRTPNNAAPALLISRTGHSAAESTVHVRA